MTAPTPRVAAHDLVWTFAIDDDDPAAWHVLPAQTFSHVPSRRCLCDPVPCCGLADVLIHKDMRRRRPLELVREG